MKAVRLKNGTEEFEGLVKITMVSLSQMMERNPVALYELVQVCKDRNHKPWGNAGEVLKQFAFLDANGGVHDSIRNIVLSAIEGEDLDMHLVNPVKD